MCSRRDTTEHGRRISVRSDLDPSTERTEQRATGRGRAACAPAAAGVRSRSAIRAAAAGPVSRSTAGTATTSTIPAERPRSQTRGLQPPRPPVFNTFPQAAPSRPIRLRRLHRHRRSPYRLASRFPEWSSRRHNSRPASQASLYAATTAAIAIARCPDVSCRRGQRRHHGRHAPQRRGAAERAAHAEGRVHESRSRKRPRPRRRRSASGGSIAGEAATRFHRAVQERRTSGSGRQGNGRNRRARSRTCRLRPTRRSSIAPSPRRSPKPAPRLRRTWDA